MWTSDLCKRIIPCLDVAHGRTVKGVKFQGLRDVGDPVEQALSYQEEGADEILLLDIMASVDGRKETAELAERVADTLSIPFTIGGGISSLEDAVRLLRSGADKVSVNTAAVERPELIAEIAGVFGSQCCVVAIDARRFTGSSDRSSGGAAFEVLTKGGRVSTGIDALEWARQAVELGAGEILLTSWDQDGTLSGFDIELTEIFSSSLPVPVIASGGAAGPQCFVDAFQDGKADAALAATIFHDRSWTVRALKEAISARGIKMRLC